MRSVLADTGPLYTLVDRDDSLHNRARDEAKRIETEGWTVVVALPTLLEGYTLVLRSLGFQAAGRWLEELTHGSGFLNPHRDDYLAASRRIRKFADHPITLFDGLLAVLADQLQLQVWTFDHHFDVMGAQVWR